jgi:tetratricopeptide (TPR) repeat protein
MKTLIGKASVTALMLTWLSAIATAQALQQLYDEHRWFELSESIKSEEVPALYRGAVASAFNNSVNAERYLNEVIGNAPHSKAAEIAREKLADLYNRLGMSHEALRQFDEILRMYPGRSDVENVRPIFASFSRYPYQSIGKKQRAVVHAEVSAKGVVIPISINGKTVHWGLDKDFSISIMSESEARMLGLAIDNVSAQASDSSGGAAKVRTNGCTSALHRGPATPQCTLRGHA